jgi:ribose 5-phosphate isomerase B
MRHRKSSRKSASQAWRQPPSASRHRPSSFTQRQNQEQNEDVVMSGKRVAVAAVIKAFELKSFLHDHLTRQGHRVLDLGCFNPEVFVKYPSVGEAVAHALYTGDADFGVICCNYGSSACSGVAKFRGVCAFASESVQTAEMCRKVNGANVLCMGQAVVSPDLAPRMVDTFLSAEFLGIEGAPEKVREFRRQARDRLIARGEIPKGRDLETLD